MVLRIDGLNAYRLSEGPGTYLVLSDGLDIGGVGEGSCLLNLSPGQAAATDAKADLAQFVAGARCSYEVDAKFRPRRGAAETGPANAVIWKTVDP